MKKKILRIDDVTLTSNEKSQIFGGAKGPEPSCKCGCGICTYEDGGPGFAIGMTLTGEDCGYVCPWGVFKYFF